MISIIIPIYNSGQYLNRCLDSVRIQTYKDFEVILVNDGSTDDSEKICRSYCNSDNRFLMINKENGGSASARNIGLLTAHGEYVAFIDADDYVDAGYLKVLYDNLRFSNADISVCDFMSVSNYSVNKPNKKINLLKCNSLQILKQFCDSKTYLKICVLWNKLYKKQLFDGMQFPVGKGIDDEFLICEIIHRAKIIAVTNEILYFYFLSPNSQMRSGISLKSFDSLEAIEKQLELFKKIDIKLYKKLLYRYYATVLGCRYQAKKYFPQEKELNLRLKLKSKGINKYLLNPSVSFFDKGKLVIRRIVPHLFDKEGE